MAVRALNTPLPKQAYDSKGGKIAYAPQPNPYTQKAPAVPSDAGGPSAGRIATPPTLPAVSPTSSLAYPTGRIVHAGAALLRSIRLRMQVRVANCPCRPLESIFLWTFWRFHGCS